MAEAEAATEWTLLADDGPTSILPWSAVDPIEEHLLNPHKKVGVMGMVCIAFFWVSGGIYGNEELIGSAPGAYVLTMVVVMPLVFSLPIALITAELASRFPVDGGQCVYVQRACGDAVGGHNCYWVFVVNVIDATIYPLLAAQYLGYHIEMDYLHSRLFAICLIAAVTAINLGGLEALTRFQGAIFVLTLLPCLIFIGSGIGELNYEAFTSTDNTAVDVPLMLSWVIWLYSGFSSLGTIAGECDKPHVTYVRTIAILFPLVIALNTLPFMVALSIDPDVTNYKEVDGTFASRVVPWLLDVPVSGVPRAYILFTASVSMCLCWLPYGVLVEFEVMLYCLSQLMFFYAFVYLRAAYPEANGKFNVGTGVRNALALVIVPVLICVANLYIGLYVPPGEACDSASAENAAAYAIRRGLEAVVGSVSSVSDTVSPAADTSFDPGPNFKQQAFVTVIIFGGLLHGMSAMWVAPETEVIPHYEPLDAPLTPSRRTSEIQLQLPDGAPMEEGELQRTPSRVQLGRSASGSRYRFGRRSRTVSMDRETLYDAETILDSFLPQLAFSTSTPMRVDEASGIVLNREEILVAYQETIEMQSMVPPAGIQKKLHVGVNVAGHMTQPKIEATGTKGKASAAAPPPNARDLCGDLSFQWDHSTNCRMGRLTRHLGIYAFWAACGMHAFAAVSSAMRTSVAMHARGVHLLVSFDGGSRGNPGISGCGAVVADARDNATLLEMSHYMPGNNATCNEAEYTAALLGVYAAAQLAKKLPVERLTLQGDSRLVIKQLTGEWRVTKPNLVPLHKNLTDALELAFEGRYDARWLPREDNTLADALANEAMNSRKGTKRKQHEDALARLETELGLEKGALLATEGLENWALLATEQSGRGAAPARPASPAQSPSAVPATATASLSAAARRRAAVEAEGAVAGQGSPDLSLTAVRKMRRADLQTKCWARGLSEEGGVEDLRDRLRTALREDESRKMIARVNAQRRGRGEAGAAKPFVKLG
ncbi:amino acid permease-domain-containing protein [Pavlovales sp. CCMP2436]|nr:amino acid permease-domain-containing protein [Pavlovales sp. CCMP2436]